MAPRCVARRRNILVLFLYYFPFFLFLILCSVQADSAEVTLEWDANTDTMVTGYKLYYRSCLPDEACDSIGNTQNLAAADIPISTLADPQYPAFHLTNLPDNRKFVFACTAYYANGSESQFSNQVLHDGTSPPPPTPPQTIVDNGGSDVQTSGTWSVSGGATPYGTNSFYSRSTNATYTFLAPGPGFYNIHMWWTTWSNRCTDVPVEIYDGTTLIETVHVNQRVNGGSWNQLGSYQFQNTPGVRIVSQGGCSTCADAVRFDSTYATDLTKIDVEGPATIGENTEAQLQCRAYYTDGTNRLVDVDYWVVSCPDYADISNTGNISGKTVTSDQQCQVWAEYEEGGIFKEAVKDIIILDQPDTASTVIIDNRSPQVTQIGTWKVSGGQNPYGQDSVYSRKPDDRFTFNADLNGSYTVALRWTEYTTRCQNIPISVYNGNTLMDRIIVNQQTNGGQWNTLGGYTFSGKASVSITVPEVCSTCADAIRFQPTGKQNEIVDESDTNATAAGSWKVSGGLDPYGSQSLYSSNRNTSYLYKGSTAGTHRILLWWTVKPSRCSSVPVEIYDGEKLIDTRYVDQINNGGQWNEIGTYHFNNLPSVKIISTGTCTTCADAVQFD